MGRRSLLYTNDEARAELFAPARGGPRQFLPGCPIAFPAVGDYHHPHAQTEKGLGHGAWGAHGSFLVGGSTMKAASKFLLGLAVVFAVTVLTTARAEEEKKKEAKAVTLKGDLGCAKCVFKVEGIKACTNAIKTKVDGKEVVYILIDKGKKEKYHGKICTDSAPGSVTGVTSKKGDKYYIKPKGKDAVKFD
jgi:hypothetical protein